MHGGDATADDFLDAFGFGDDAGGVEEEKTVAAGDDINYADELKKYLKGALNSVLAAQPKDPFREMQQVLFQKLETVLVKTLGVYVVTLKRETYRSTASLLHCRARRDVPPMACEVMWAVTVVTVTDDSRAALWAGDGDMCALCAAGWW